MRDKPKRIVSSVPLNAVSSHRTYVEGVLRHYRENDIRPGDPNEGKWEEAHYPTPKRLGGTETILLLKEHHAVQGVLQSEEFQCMCFAMWERDYLPEHLLEMHDKWKGHQSSLNLHSYFDRLTPKEHQAHLERMWAGRTEESEARRIAASSATQIERASRPVLVYDKSGECAWFRSVRHACTTLKLTGHHLRRTLTPRQDGQLRFTKGYRMVYVND